MDSSYDVNIFVKQSRFTNLGDINELFINDSIEYCELYKGIVRNIE